MLNIPQYAWICLNKQDSEYALGPKYAKILNMVKFWTWYLIAFWICQNMLWQSSEYISGFKYARLVNMAGSPWATQSSKYTTIYLNLSEFMIIDMIVSVSCNT